MRTRGETVTLERPDGTRQEVRNVLVRPLRYGTETVTVSVSWPKKAPHDVAGCHLTIRGERFRIYGHPFPLSYSPTAHDMRFEATTAIYRHDVYLLGDSGKAEARARLIEKHDGDAGAPRARELARTVALEIEPGKWFDGCAFFEFEGDRYRIEGANLLEYETGGGVTVVGTHTSFV